MRRLLDERGIRRKFILDNTEYCISRRSLSDLKKLDRELEIENLKIVVLGFKDNGFFRIVKKYQVHSKKLDKGTVGRPLENDKQFLYISLWHILFDIYLSVAWTKKVENVKNWKNLVKSGIEDALNEWLEKQGISIGTSETNFKMILRKIKDICQQEILITHRTPRPDIELEQQVLKSSIGFYVRGYFRFQDSPLISINRLYNRIVRDIQKNGVDTIGKFGWYRVDNPEPDTEEFFLRKQLNEKQFVFEKVLQECLDMGYSEEDAYSEAEKEANNLFKE